MQRHLFLMIILFFCKSLAADTSATLGLRMEEGQSIIFNQQTENEWVIGLEDGSFWNLKPLTEKRKRTWYEWWHNITPLEWGLDDSFFVDPKDWKGHFKVDICEVEQTIYPLCMHVLVNSNTGKKVFAEFIPSGMKRIPSVVFAEQFFNSSYQNSCISLRIIGKGTVLNNIIILEDESCWKIFPFQKNAATWGQWFRGEKIDQPDEAFIFNLSDWRTKDELQIYLLKEDVSLLNKYEAKLKTTKKMKNLFLIENKNQNQLVYAQKMSVHEILLAFQAYAKEQWNAGYHQRNRELVLQQMRDSINRRNQEQEAARRNRYR